MSRHNGQRSVLPLYEDERPDVLLVKASGKTDLPRNGTGNVADLGEHLMIVARAEVTAVGHQRHDELGLIRVQTLRLTDLQVVDPVAGNAAVRAARDAAHQQVTMLDEGTGEVKPDVVVHTDANGVLLLEDEAAALRGEEPATEDSEPEHEVDVVGSFGEELEDLNDDRAEAERVAAGYVSYATPPDDDEWDDTTWLVFADGRQVGTASSPRRAGHLATLAGPQQWVCVIPMADDVEPGEVRDDEIQSLVAKQWIREHAPWFGLRPADAAIAGLDALDPVVPTWALRLLLFVEERTSTPRPELVDELQRWIAEDSGATEDVRPAEEASDVTSPAPQDPGEEAAAQTPPGPSPADPSEEGGAPTHPDDVPGQADAPSSLLGTVGSPSSGDPSVHAETIAALWPKGITRYRLDQIQKSLRQRVDDGETDPLGLIAAVRFADITEHPEGKGRRNVLRYLDTLDELVAERLAGMAGA